MAASCSGIQRGRINLLPLLTGEGAFQQRDFLMMQAGSKHEVLFRGDGWNLILQSDHKVTKFVPIALFNLNENPHEDEKRNLINAPKQAERVKELRDAYIRVRTSGQRTTPVIGPNS